MNFTQLYAAGAAGLTLLGVLVLSMWWEHPETQYVVACARAYIRRHRKYWKREVTMEMLLVVALRLACCGERIRLRLAQRIYIYAGPRCVRLVEDLKAREAEMVREREKAMARLALHLQKMNAKSHAATEKVDAPPCTKVTILADELQLVDDSTRDVIEYTFKLPDGRSALYLVERATFQSMCERHGKANPQPKSA